MWIDHWVAACLVPLALWILLSGLDDLFIDLVYWLTGRQQFRWPARRELEETPQRRIAVLLPLWREAGVIGPMLKRNLSVVRYANYDIFVGVYPNDKPTSKAVNRVARRNSRVHVSMCLHDGPTSKGDCLNRAYACMELYEAQTGGRYEIVVIHDAEDLIHPDSFRLINWFSRDYAMVQVPVLPLPTGAAEITHGVYCDEFAESHSKDMQVRRRLGGFLPSSGVGAGFDRAALERLAEDRQGRVFDPECLTEDYETGYRLHALGLPQMFLPIRSDGRDPIATREYFPQRLRAAVRQRGRWLAGIALQGWERHGWRTTWPQRYWLWRDRKSLIGNLLTPVANLFFLYGLATCIGSGLSGRLWHFGSHFPSWLAWVSGATFSISVIQTAVRAVTAARVYGWRFGLMTPLRMPWANVINCAATLEGFRQFFGSRLKRSALVWNKTEHTYPAHAEYQELRARI